MCVALFLILLVTYSSLFSHEIESIDLRTSESEPEAMLDSAITCILFGFETKLKPNCQLCLEEAKLAVLGHQFSCSG
jgi:hypothetical protein